MNNTQNTKNNYAVVFKGSFQDDINKSDATQAFADLFKIDLSKANSILGQSCVLKKDLDHKSASKYLIALEKTGIMVELINQARTPQSKPLQDNNNQEKLTQQEENREPSTEVSDNTDTILKILPAGSDVLTDQERAKPTQQSIDTSHIKMASVFLAPEESNAKIDLASMVHIPNLTIADIGEELLVIKPRRQTTAEINSDFDLKPVGSDLLEENEKKNTHGATAPDTSHLSIED